MQECKIWALSPIVYIHNHIFTVLVTDAFTEELNKVVYADLHTNKRELLVKR